MPDNQVWTIKQVLDWCEKYLRAHNDENPKLSAQWLVSEATSLARVELFMNFDKPLSESERSHLRETLKRRGAGEPLQYISGEAAFRHIVVKAQRGVLIPRPETEMLVQLVLDWLAEQDEWEALSELRELEEASDQGEQGEQREQEGQVECPHILEVGTGSGCIACSLAKEAGAKVLATDISACAVECARNNVQLLKLDDLVEVVETDCVNGISGNFDVLVSNPPYIPHEEMQSLNYEVAGFEPHVALDGGSDGLEFFNRLLNCASQVLKKGGLFACELHETTLEKAVALLEQAGFNEVKITKDLAGKQRFISAILI